ncbi:hypothetical protein ABIA31_007314 [Catenulispora sp. MAP5-51]|uniref:hypothetical protein n=1 Tax=Catenulispora sp. MAP5-51 TaxID=3156298 RepID=UPI0035157D72
MATILARTVLLRHRLEVGLRDYARERTPECATPRAASTIAAWPGSAAASSSRAALRVASYVVRASR